MTTSTSPRRRHVVISSASRSTPVAPRDAQRLGDLRLGDAEHPQHLAGGTRSRPPIAARNALGRDAPRPTSAAARAAGPGSTTTVGPARRRRAARRSPGAVPTGSRIVGARRAPSPACGCRARIASRSRSGQRLRQPLEDRRDPPLERLVEHERAARRTPRRPARSGRPRSGRGRRSCTTRSMPSRGEEVERGAHVLGPVADDDRVRVVDAELAQALGQPRAVAVERRGR